MGYSGHEVGLAVSYAAAAMGITSLERHIALNRSMYGSDQAASIEPSGLRTLVGGVRKIEQAMGDGKKRILDSEVPIAKKLRSHIKWEASGNSSNKLAFSNEMVSFDHQVDIQDEEVVQDGVYHESV